MTATSAHPVTEGTLSRSEIMARLRAALPEILGARPVIAAYLYGSVADGRVLPGSDVDIALILTPGCNLATYDRMALELDIAAEIADCDLGREVDVRIINEAPLAVQGVVLTEGILLYSGDDMLRQDYEVLTRKLYFDFLPTIRMMRQAYFRAKGESLRRQGLLRDG